VAALEAQIAPLEQHAAGEGEDAVLHVECVGARVVGEDGLRARGQERPEDTDSSGRGGGGGAGAAAW